MPRTRAHDVRTSEADGLRRLRERSGLTQADLAEAFGVAKSAVAQWEAHERTIPGPVLELIALYSQHLGLAEKPPGDARSWISWATRSSAGARAATLWLVVHGADAVPSPIAKHLRDSALRQFVKTLGGMKGLSAKLLDMVAYMDFLLPEDRELPSSWERPPKAPMPPFLLRDIFLEEFGRTPRELFREWSPTPIAVASIGQVHRAVTMAGEAVAVKVQHPRIVEILRADLRKIDLLDRITCLVWPAQRRGEIHEELRDGLLAECDFRLELENLRTFAASFRGREGLAFPQPVAALSSSRVLTSTWLTGRTLDDFVRDASPAERDHAAGIIWTFFYESWFRDARFHADPNPGNFLFTASGVSFLDFGRVKTVSAEYIGIYRRLARALLECDIATFRSELVRARFVPDPASYDFHYAFRASLTFYKPCLLDAPFRFTVDYIRSLWKLFTGNANRDRSSFPRELIFMEQFYFGVGSLLARLDANVHCRSKLLELLYEEGETHPPPFTENQLQALGVNVV